MAAIPHMNRLNAMARAAGESPPTEAALERYAALQLRRPKPRRQAPGVTVNLPPGVPPETPLSKQLAEIDAGLIKESRQQASEAAQQAVSLRQLEVLLEGQKSGKGVPTIREYQGALATFGVELGDQSAVAAYQAAETVAAQLALRARNPEGGLGLTGNTSERDLMFLRSIPPSFAKTPDANKIIFEMHRQVAEYKIKRDKLIQRLARDDNYMSQEDWDKIIEFESSDIFSDDFKKRAARILGMGSEQPATQRRPIDLGLPGFRLLE